MRQLSEVSKELEATGTIVELTSAFEGIASMRIAQIKDQVLSSEKFFEELWHIYSQIRVDELFHFGRSQSVAEIIEKELMILITAEGSFSGDIDLKLIDVALKSYSPAKNDILVVGHHGAIRLAQADVPVTKSFKLPQKDRNINVMPIVSEVQKYASTTVYYQSYISLMTQEVKSIKLSAAVAERGKSSERGEEIISEQNYIFEPSTYEVIDHLENSMMQITLSEAILESKLAQYASRFKAMSTARDKSEETYKELSMHFNRTKRYLKDERLKEVINSLRKATS
ncbi:F0F1 ATP synthase subunit gamma [Candidatus Saccharibacteria bacterium]|nr:F0F1 ATP synthase subunit gamma [Candidatus Saccharibacteria bacterium]